MAAESEQNCEPLMISLTKYHGLGNDFLVLLALDEAVRACAGDLAGLARRTCDRHRGFGADGLLVALPPSSGDGSAATMVLYNADGSRAEMSGNGIRCFVHGLIDGGVVSPGTVIVATDVGPRIVEVEAPSVAGEAWMRVDVGTAKVVVGPDIEGSPSALVDVGNPHVVVEFIALPDIAVFGPRVEAGFLPVGINVEAVRVDGDGMQMAVWERGVGVTQACGTGAVASAAAARSWGRVGDRVVVSQPGGDATVEMSGPLDGPSVTLIGPSQRIGRCEIG